MTRPRIKAKRDKQLNFSLTAEELTTLRFRAAAAGMHLVDYGRAMLLGKPMQVADFTPEHATNVRLRRLVHAQLSRIGNNLNQITRHLHTFREPAPPSLEPVLQELRTDSQQGGGA